LSSSKPRVLAAGGLHHMVKKYLPDKLKATGAFLP
jgi:hypothetical protein